VKKSLLVASCVVSIALIGIAIWYFVPAGGRAHSAAAAAPFVVPPIQNEYTNDTLGFSVGLPDGFTAQEFEDEETKSRTIVLQDAQGNGIQILATPFPEDLKVLDAARIQRDIPDMKISDVQSVEIGANHTGIAFMSDNEAFEGASREVWFVFRGTLYQISTYARLDSLLQSMFGTWKFN
jgi:hypothetical protein